MTGPGRKRAFHLPWPSRRTVDEEIRFHVDLRARDLIEEGLDPDAARAQAEQEFGDVRAAAGSLHALDESLARRTRRTAWLDGLRQDTRLAARRLARSPAFTALAALTLALGIGACTALFSAVHAVLLRALPYPAEDRLTVLWQDHGGRGGPAREHFNLPDFAAVRDGVETLEGVAAVVAGDAVLTGEAGAERIGAPMVSHEYFRLFGARPALGRFFRPGDETSAGEPLAVLAHDLWRRRFGADPAVVGRSIPLDGRAITVIGIAEAGFRPPEGPSDLWLPLRSDPSGASWRFYLARVYGRLRPGVEPARARTELAAIAAGLAADHPERNAGVRFAMEGLRAHVVGPVARALWAVFGAAGLLLLLACANLAGLLLSRAAARERELGIRAALGAGWGRLVRQLMTESLMLAGLGGLLGVGLACGGVPVLVALASPGVPRLEETAIDGTVLSFALALSLATAVVFGLAPALRAAGAHRRRGRGRSSGPVGRETGRATLVVGQVAIALILLVGAGLLGGSLLRLLRVDPGFDPANVLTAELRASSSGSPDAAFHARLEERLEALPGVGASGSVTVLPLGGASRDMRLRVEGRSGVPPDGQPRAHYRFASRGYFEAMGIALRAGRPFGTGDRPEGPGVVIVNETLAERLWPGTGAVGRRLGAEVRPGEWFTVAGVVADVRHRGLDEPPLPEIYFPAEQWPGASAFRTLVLRTSSDPLAVAAALREAVRELDPDLPVDRVSTLERRVGDSLAVRRTVLSLFAGFAVLALGLALLGIYGVLSATVVRRTREIGIRMALGGHPRTVLRGVVGRGLALTAVGVALGAACALVLARLLRTLLFGVAPSDPLTLAAVAALVLGVGFLASLVPARRATRIQPGIALRAE